MTIADILAQLGILSDAVTDTGEPTPAADGATQAVAQSVLALESVVQALEEPFLKMQDMAEAAFAQLDAFVRATPLPAERMEAWMAAAERYHVPVEEITRAINGIQAAIGEIQTSAINKNPWELLGIHPDQDPFDVLDQLREHIRTITPSIARSVLADMGIGDGMFRLLMQPELDLGADAGRGGNNGLPGLVQNLMAGARSATTWASDIFSGVRSAIPKTMNVQDIAETLADRVSPKTLARMDDTLHGIAEPIGNAMQLASGFFERVDKNNMTSLMSRLTPAPGMDVPGAISQAFLTQPSPTLRQRAGSDEPVATPNTTVNVTQHIEGGGNSQAVAESVIRKIVGMASVQFPRKPF